MDTNKDDVNRLKKFVDENFNDCEVEIQDGKQPLYYYIFSVE
jgi:dihydroxyacetone kinase-like predicted kinase